MTDTVKQFYNSNPTFAQLQAGVSLVSPAVNTAAFVKSILLRSTTSRQFGLFIGPTMLNSWTGTAELSGTELVPSGATLALKALSGPAFNNVAFAPSTVSLVQWNGATMFGDDVGETSESYVASVTTSITTALGYTPDFICFDAAGNFYYGTRSTQDIRRRAGGVNGAETLHASFGEVKCFDGERYLYGMTSSTTLKVLDTLTNTVSTVTLSANPSSFHNIGSRLCAIDGYVIHAGSNGVTGDIFNASTGARTGGFQMDGVSTALRPMEINKDLDGNYWILSFNNDTTQWINGLGPDLSRPTAVFRSFTITGGLTPTSNPYYNRLWRPKGVPGVLVGVSTNSVFLYDIQTGKTLATKIGTTAFPTYPFCPLVDVDKAAAHFGTVSARCVGVEVS